MKTLFKKASSNNYKIFGHKGMNGSTSFGNKSAGSSCHQVRQPDMNEKPKHSIIERN
jgi:hypothetical protein